MQNLIAIVEQHMCVTSRVGIISSASIKLDHNKRRAK
jgi:hypothetical protein